MRPVVYGAETQWLIACQAWVQTLLVPRNKYIEQETYSDTSKRNWLVQKQLRP